jgi:cyclin-dependent kinase regulatory subunit CKS1
MSASRIEYSEKYADDHNEYRYVSSVILQERVRTCLAITCSAFFALLSCNVPRSHFVLVFRFSMNSHVILPKELAKSLPKSRLLTESEWRGIGVQQSRGWGHYAVHRYAKPLCFLLPFA